MSKFVSANLTRRSLGTIALGITAAGVLGETMAEASQATTRMDVSKDGTGSALEANKTIRAGDLLISYADVGPATGSPVLLLHGWPYDINSFAQVAPLLADQGHRVIVPFLRGYGGTRFLSGDTKRNGQQAAIAGFDWGARTADIVAALWPERCRALVSVSGYLIGSQNAGRMPLPPSAELQWWYQYYFATDRGQEGYRQYTSDFARLIWHLASPRWDFDDRTFEMSAKAFANPDHIDIVVHNYRWRLGLAPGEDRFDRYEAALAKAPDISVPTITSKATRTGHLILIPRPTLRSSREDMNTV